MWQARIKITPRLTHPWHRDATMMHGIISTLHGQDHTSQIPLFALHHHDGDWHVIMQGARPVWMADKASWPVLANGRPVSLSPVGIRELELPPISAARGRVVLSTLTPVVMTAKDHTRSCVAPDLGHMTRAIQRVSDGLGLGVDCERMGGLEMVSSAVIGTRTVIGGHVSRGTAERGAVIGWVGSMVLDCSPMALWVLRCAEIVGMGGLKAYGFGRIRIERQHEQR